MKKTFYLIYIFSLIALVGCNNDATSPTSTGFGVGDNNNNGNVTIQVQGAADGQGNYIFSLKPSVNITLTTVSPSVAAANYSEDFDFSGQGEWQANTYEGFLQYDAGDIQQGQAWTFKFVGKTTADNKTFTVTTNYTIP